MNPFKDYLVRKDGTKAKKVYIMYIDGDPKLCDGCDVRKRRVASIKGIGSDVWCICEDCVYDLYCAWGSGKELVSEAKIKEE
jgi:hypothetical protein